jgi:hypothetical protein
MEVDRQHPRISNEHSLDQSAQGFVTKGMPVATNVVLVDLHEGDRRFSNFLF